jgi:hypothetical protein
MANVRSRWILRALVAAVLPIAVLGAAVPSQAAPAAGHLGAPGATSWTFTVPAGTASLSVGSPGARVTVVKAPAQVPMDITCTLRVSTPFVYFGGTYGGGEEGLATTQCTGIVYQLTTEVALFRNNVQVTYNSYTNYSTTTTTADTEYPRMSGQYTTAADSFITWTFGGTTSFIPINYSATVTL